VVPVRVGTNTAAHTLGLNATGTSWVTGLGPNAVRRPLHTPSLADGIDDPVPGLPVYGPAAYDSSAGILGAALSAYAPTVTRWPLHERFADVSYVPVYNEFTVAESLAPTLFAFGYLAELAYRGEVSDTGDSGGGDATDTAGGGRAVDGAGGGGDGCGCADAPDGARAAGVGALLGAMLARRRRRA